MAGRVESDVVSRTVAGKSQFYSKNQMELFFFSISVYLTLTLACNLLHIIENDAES